MDERTFPGVEGTFIHPFDDHDFVAGNATVALEILEDLPSVKTIIAAIGGGGLVAGIGSAIRALAPHVRVLGAEPETAAPGAVSFAAGSPQVFENWEASFVDGAGGKSIFPRMWERLKDTVDGSTVVTLEEVKSAMRIAASKARVIAEGAGALSIAAALRESEGAGGGGGVGRKHRPAQVLRDRDGLGQRCSRRFVSCTCLVLAALPPARRRDACTFSRRDASVPLRASRDPGRRLVGGVPPPGSSADLVLRSGALASRRLNVQASRLRAGERGKNVACAALAKTAAATSPWPGGGSRRGWGIRGDRSFGRAAC